MIHCILFCSAVKLFKVLITPVVCSIVQVHELCSSLLVSHPACSFVVVTLHTLSCLAVSSVIDIPKQVKPAFGYLFIVED